MANDELEFAQATNEVTVTIPLSPENEERFSLITRNLQEFTGGDIIRKVLADGETPRLYWGTAITGRPHIAYCVPIVKIADFLNAGVHVSRNLHGFLDANKSSWETLKHRVVYYSNLLHAVFTTIGVPTDKLEFVQGTTYQLTPEYTLDMYKYHNLTTTKAAEHAGADVVKESESPLMSSLLYPGLQALDEEYLNVHAQFGGVDQRKIFMYAAHFLPKMGYAKRAHLMNQMVPGLTGAKMSSSEPKSKIDFLDSDAEVKSKLKGAVCAPGEVEGNGVLAFLRAVLVPIQNLREDAARREGKERYTGEGSFPDPQAPAGTIFSIKRPEKFGGDLHFPSYAALEASYAKGEFHPQDLKNAVADALVKLLGPIRAAFEANPEWQEAERLGYPDSSVSAAAIEAAKKNAAKKEPKKKVEKSNKPPTEEERAALRAKKEQEKAAKAAAKAAAAGPSAAVLNTTLPKLKLLSKGKVRDIYALPDAKDSDKLLFVATDRISAFDVIMENGIPQKGATLTTLSAFWFHKLRHIIPNHVLTPSLEGDSPAVLSGATAWEEFPRSLDEYRDQLEGRSMIVKKGEVVKIEAIVRGYITGSAWSEYKKSQTVHGIPMPAGLVESQKLPTPIFTPSTKADLGEHDENIHPDKVKDITGPELAAEIEKVAVKLYTEAAAYALERGLILADTKFEFGLIPGADGKKQLILIDEALTPDSSRYWAADAYKAGQPQDSFDKQYLRDWLINSGKKAQEGVSLPGDVVAGTKAKYEEARDRVMGRGAFAK
ncbi:hypothetical protein Q8F55_001398 [Vanrija albida]|uniref:Tyrosine--tRNA ligase n=1 Tax=Vanrija albida TaxID=181172 RepID=A0ABR3QFW9_9TREE